jgi:hypothetical protein
MILLTTQDRGAIALPDALSRKRSCDRALSLLKGDRPVAFRSKLLVLADKPVIYSAFLLSKPHNL